MTSSDVIIIGSGFGGAIPAQLLSREGGSVTLLERGPWRDTTEVTAAGIHQRAALPHGWQFLPQVLHRLHHRWLPTRGVTINPRGLLELFFADGINVVCSNGVGGGSHVYSGLHALPLHENYWDGRAEGVSVVSMAPHYEALLTQFGSRQPPLLHGCEGPALPEGFSALLPSAQPHWGYRSLDVDGRSVDFREEGMFGSPRGNKLTLDSACLLPAMADGLRLEAECEVVSIARETSGVFCVTARRPGNRFEAFRAPRVIVAAGAVNTVSLLLRSRAGGGLSGMPALGRGFGSNGDVMAYWPVNQSGVDHTVSGVYERMFAHQEDKDGPVFMQTGIAGLAAIPIPSWLKRRLRQDLFVAGMGVDSADGHVGLHGQRIRLSYSRDNSPVFARAYSRLCELGVSSAVSLRIPSAVTTVHPLGGAVLGDDETRAVIDAKGQVYGIPGLYVTDAAALPAALGAPPSLSIAAWARHVAMSIARQG